MNACKPERFHWYYNNIIYRSTLNKQVESYLAAGTTRNEQFHARLNAHFRTTVSISKRMLEAELSTWLTAEMAVWLRAYEAKLTRRVSRVNMLPFVTSSIIIFTKASWQIREGGVARVVPADEGEDIEEAQRSICRAGGGLFCHPGQDREAVSQNGVRLSAEVSRGSAQVSITDTPSAHRCYEGARAYPEMRGTHSHWVAPDATPVNDISEVRFRPSPCLRKIVACQTGVNT